MTWLIASLLTLVPAAGPPGTPPAVLVAQLGSEDFTQRQTAEDALRGWGVAALPALEAALDVPDLEQRHRTRRLLQDLWTRLAASNLGRLRRGDMPLRVGLWNHFRRTVGDSRAAREMFRTMYALQGAAFEELDMAIRRRDWAEVRHLANSSVARTLPSEPEVSVRLPDYPPWTSNRLLTVLFLSQLPGVERKAATDELLISNMIGSDELQSISFKRDQNARVLQTLVIHWFAAHRPYSSNQDLMLQLIVLEIREPGLELARKRLQGEARPSEKAVAASYLGWYGRPADAALILPLLDDKTPYRDRFANVQIRDMALAALDELTRASLGTALRLDNRPTVVREVTCWRRSGRARVVRPGMSAPLFASNAEREAAFAAWRKWVAANPEKLPAMRK